MNDKSPESTGELYWAGTSREAQARGTLGHRQTCPEQADGSRGPHPRKAGWSSPEPWAPGKGPDEIFALWKELKCHWRTG